MRRAWRLFILAAVCALTACGGDDGPPSGPPPGADGAVAACVSDVDCDDGAVCNGVETCADGACAAGTPLECDDGQGCTMDSCSEDAGGCVFTAPDVDGDGHTDSACGGDDCDDADATAFPGNTEVCDADDHDEDCDPTTYGFRDADNDGWPDARCCNGTECGTDCDDTLPSAHPSEAESCDGLDNDCDGSTDEGVTDRFFEDSDRDGYGAPMGMTRDACFAPDGFADRNDDCDDMQGGVHPGAPEICDAMMLDEDCDGTANPAALCNCMTGASGACPLPGACSAGTRDCVGGMWTACSIAGTPEICDGEDDDCDGSTDEGLLVRCFADSDGDTFAAPGTPLTTPCPDPARTFVGMCPVGFTDREPIGAVQLDCDDMDPARFPMAVEVCDAVDQDCDGAIDEGRRVRCWRDRDGDGFALSGASPMDVCPAPGTTTCPAGLTSREPLAGAVDCDDRNSARSPSAIETCNGVDDDCDVSTDESLTITCWIDADRDGFPPSGASSTMSCPDPMTGGCPSGTTTMNPASSPIDCDDSSAARSPAVAEACNSVDDDCDLAVDEGVLVTCWPDGDGDSFAPMGAMMSTICPMMGGACPSGSTSRGPGAGTSDCNDMNAGVSPAVTEVCNGTDDDCDGMTDEGLLAARYPDADGDGFGDSRGMTMNVCPSTPGYADNNLDCFDSDNRVFPGQLGVFTTPACPAGTSPCAFNELLPGPMIGSRLDGYGCAPPMTSCDASMAHWDFDCDRRVIMTAVAAACASPGSSCGGGCTGTPGLQYDSRDPAECGGTHYPADCTCPITSPTCQVRAVSSMPAPPLGCR